MKILQIVKTNEGATWAFTQAKWLFDNGVDIATILPSTEGGMAEKYKESGMKVLEGDFTLPVSRPWNLLKRARKLKAIINQENPDIIHCHFVTNVMMVRLALRKSNIPRLFQVPGPLHLENILFRKAEIFLAENNDFWAGACRKTCDIYLKSGVPRERIFLAYYGGYGGKACDEYKEKPCKLHEEYNLSADKILVGMVSYFYKPKVHLLQTRGLKGHEDFIDAIALVRKEIPSVIGIIIGDAWGDSKKYVNKVKKYAEKKCKEGIIFTGFRTDIKEIYKELDIAVHPSHSENLGGAAESLAAGVPTISTNVGGFPDIVIYGKTGYTVNPRCPQDLANHIVKMIDNPKFAKRMADNGYNLVKQLLDINNTAGNILLVYNKMLYK